MRLHRPTGVLFPTAKIRAATTSDGQMRRASSVAISENIIRAGVAGDASARLPL